MANPIGILVDLEEKLMQGMPAEPCESDMNYKKFFHEFPGGKRFIYAKVVNNEVQAIAIFGHEQPLNRTERYSVGYAVRENCRGRRLSLEAVNRGIVELSTVLKRSKIESFYIEALIDEKNIPSIEIAKRLFPRIPVSMPDDVTGTPAKLFCRLIRV